MKPTTTRVKKDDSQERLALSLKQDTMNQPIALPTTVTDWNNDLTVTEKGLVFSENAKEIPQEAIIDLLKSLSRAETACGLAEGDAVNFLIGIKGQDLVSIAAATGISARDLKKRSNVCSRIPYANRQPELHLDFHIAASQSKADDASEWLEIAEQEHLDRQQLKKSVELQRLATKEDMEVVIEDHDEGTETFGSSITRIVVLNGQFSRAGFYDEMSPEDCFDLHEDFLPVLEVWRDVVKRFNGRLPDSLQKEFDETLKDLTLALSAENS